MSKEQSSYKVILDEIANCSSDLDNLSRQTDAVLKRRNDLYKEHEQFICKSKSFKNMKTKMKEMEKKYSSLPFKLTMELKLKCEFAFDIECKGEVCCKKEKIVSYNCFGDVFQKDCKDKFYDVLDIHNTHKDLHYCLGFSLSEVNKKLKSKNSKDNEVVIIIDSKCAVDGIIVFSDLCFDELRRMDKEIDWFDFIHINFIKIKNIDMNSSHKYDKRVLRDNVDCFLNEFYVDDLDLKHKFMKDLSSDIKELQSMVVSCCKEFAVNADTILDYCDVLDK